MRSSSEGKQFDDFLVNGWRLSRQIWRFFTSMFGDFLVNVWRLSRQCLATFSSRFGALPDNIQ